MATHTQKTNPFLDAALQYAARGWHVFPCHTPTPSGGCSCRNAQCTDQGKHPRTRNGFKDASTDPATLRRWWRQFPTANIGIATGTVSGIAVLDEDTYKGGDVTRQELEHTYSPLPATIQQLTGGGGVQYFFAVPDTPVPSRVQSLGGGLDTRGEGGYVIAPPSLHLSGRPYVWEVTHDPDDTPLAPFPDWLLALLRPTRAHPTVDVAAPILSGARDATLFAAGCSMRARGFSYEAILAALQTMNTLQCQPPLPDEQVQLKAAQAAKYPPGRQVRNGHAPPDAAEASPVTQPWRALLLTKKNGEPTCNVANIGLMLANHPHWQGRLWWDSVRAKPMLDTLPLTKEVMTEIGQWFGVQEHLALSNLRPLEDCLLVECQRHPRDLLQHWLHSLPPWDHVPRLDDWLVDVASCVKDAYSIAVSRLIPLSMVARALRPGCLYRSVVILEGPEETGKSSLVRALASPEWYTDLSMALESKESHMYIQGVWVAEMAELDSMTRTEETRLKAFITLTEDRWIPKYSNYPVTNPRRAIFIGTTNESTYLKGQTGNTRFLPIRTGTIDIPLFLTLRDQLFAEALAAYQANPETWFLLSEEALEAAGEAREERRVTTVYEESLGEWLDQGRFATIESSPPPLIWPRRDETTWEEIATGFLKLDTPERWKDVPLQKQIAAALRALHWEQQPIWRDGKTRRVWFKP